MKNKLADFTKIPYGIFLILFLLSAAVSIFALRSNNQQMIVLRDKVFEADKNNGDVEGALAELRTFVHSHMNTDLSGGGTIKPPIQLKYTYERLVEAEQARSDKANTRIYTEAQEFCQSQNPAAVSGRSRVPCVEEYVTTHGGAAAAVSSSIPPGLYKFDFVSPSWSPDLAGWSLVASIIFFILFVASFLMDRLLKMRLKREQI